MPELHAVLVDVGRADLDGVFVVATFQIDTAEDPVAGIEEIEVIGRHCATPWSAIFSLCAIQSIHRVGGYSPISGGRSCPGGPDQQKGIAVTGPDPDPPPDEELERDLDEALEETFPASDPISPMEPREKVPPA